MAWKLQVDGYSSRIAYLIRSEMLAKMNGVSVRADIFLALDYAHVYMDTSVRMQLTLTTVRRVLHGYIM